MTLLRKNYYSSCLKKEHDVSVLCKLSHYYNWNFWRTNGQFMFQQRRLTLTSKQVQL